MLPAAVPENRGRETVCESAATVWFKPLGRLEALVVTGGTDGSVTSETVLTGWYGTGGGTEGGLVVTGEVFTGLAVLLKA